MIFEESMSEFSSQAFPFLFFVLEIFSRSRRFHILRIKLLTEFFKIIILGLSLTCYTCYSSSNWTQCDASRTKYVCEPWLDVCAKTRSTFDIRGKRFNVYERGCFVADFCNTVACKYIGQAENCDITCCDYDLCNATALLTSTKVFIVISVIFSLFGYV